MDNKFVRIEFEKSNSLSFANVEIISNGFQNFLLRIGILILTIGANYGIIIPQ